MNSRVAPKGEPGFFIGECLQVPGKKGVHRIILDQRRKRVLPSKIHLWRDKP
jgi:hypothetical protein